MYVKEIMTKQMDALTPNATLQQAAASMLKHNFGFIPVEENGTLVGVVTDRDITIHGVAENLSPDTPLSKVMTKNVIIVHEDDDVHVAANIMETGHVRRLIVLNKKEKLSGVVSLSDIATKCEHVDTSGAIIRAISEKSR